MYPQSLGENREKDCLSDFLWGCSTTPIEPDSYMSKHGLYSAVKIILPNKKEPNGFRWQHGTRQSLVLLKISVINNKWISVTSIRISGKIVPHFIIM